MGADFDPRAYLASLPTLEDVQDMGQTLLLQGRRLDGAPCFAEVPRPCTVSVGRYIEDAPIQPAHLTFLPGPKEAPAGCYVFAVDTDTPAGAAVLAKLTACTAEVGAA